MNDEEEKIIKEIEESISQELPESKVGPLDCFDCDRQPIQKYYVSSSVYATWLRELRKLRGIK